MKGSIAYRPEIDGLRAIAVVSVILFHAGFGAAGGGYVGVDIFFVISGYLITGILISEMEGGQFSLLRFYERRARRILPALFAVLVACLPFAYLWLLPSQLIDFSKSVIAVIFFCSNILFWQSENYFAEPAELKPLLHTWSLAVEEQYYLLFPFFLYVTWRLGRNRLIWIMVALAILSLGLSEWGWRNKPSANFYLAPTRAWELLVGSVCVLIAKKPEVAPKNALAGLGLVMIFASISLFDDTTPVPSLFSLFPVIGTALILLFGQQDTWANRLLSARPLVAIGLISYSAYLWHQPLFAFARLRSTSEPGPFYMGILALAALGLAWVT